MSINNLDLLAARTAQAIVTARQQEPGKLDGVATKALGVLQHDGLYAGMLFLYARPQAEHSEALAIRTRLLKMLDEPELTMLQQPLREADGQTPVAVADWAKVSAFLTREQGVLASLDKLLLLKDLFEQTLIYVRYSAKAQEIKLKVAGNQPAQGGAPTPAGPTAGGTA